MNNLSPDKIGELRDLFGKMNDSRRHLRPILSDIAASLDKGLYVDADSDEVNRLLKQILEIQEQLSNVEQLKRATNTKNLEQINKSLSVLEQNCTREEIKSTLARIATLVVDSNDQAILDAVRKVKLQAEHIINKASKFDAAQFTKVTERFVLLAEIIDNAEDFSSNEYLKVINHFQDNPLIAMVLTSRLVHFPKPVAETERVAEDIPVANVEDSNKPNKYRLNAVLNKCKKVNPDLSLMLVDKNNFTIEKAQIKKQLSVKSFNNKIHELLDSVDPMPIFKVLIKTRLFFKEDPKDILISGKLTKKIAALVPLIFDKLFNWGIVDKVTWRGREFYFLNDFGLDICLRSFTHTPPPSNISGEYFEEMVNALQLSIMFMSEARIKGDLKIDLQYDMTMPLARAQVNSNNGVNVILMFSLILLGENWAYAIAKFKMLIEQELESESELKAVFLFAFNNDDISWLKIFDTIKFKKVKFFMLTWDGLWDQDGNEVDFNDWAKLCDFTAPLEKSTTPVETPKPSMPPVKLTAPLRMPPSPFSHPAIAALAKRIGKNPLKSMPAAEVDELRKLLSTNKRTAASVNAKEVLDKTLKYVEKDIAEGAKKPPTAKLETVEPVANTETKIDTAVEVAKTETPIETETAIETAETVTEIITTDVKAPIEPAAEIIKTSDDDIVKVDILTNVTNLFKTGANGRGMLALHALRDYFSSEDEAWADYLTKEIGFILDDPLTLRSLHNFDTFSFWTGGTEIPKANIGNTFDYLNLAATIKNFYAPPNPTSYQIQKLWKQLNDDKANTALKACPAAKTLINLFNNFTDKTHRAFADCLDESGDNTEDNYNAALAQIKRVENIVDSVLHSEVNHRRVKDVVQQLFKNNGFARKYLAVDNYSSDEILNFCRQFESTDLNQIFNDANASIDEELFDAEKIGDYLDDIWNKPTVQLVRREHEPFRGAKRNKVTTVMRQLLTALLNYIHAKRNLEITGKSAKQSAPVNQALDILTDLKRQIQRLDKRANLGQVVFREFVNNLTKKLNGETVALSYCDCLLGAKYIELENDLPVVESFGVADFSLKNRAMDFEESIRDNSVMENFRIAYDTALKNYDYGILQGLVKNFAPRLGISDEEIKRKASGLERQIDRQIERIYNDFLNELELARNYSRITDQEKIDFYINAVLAAKEHFIGTKNAGIFQRFIDACNESINKVSLPQRIALTKRLEKLEEALENNLNDGETLEAKYPILSNVRRQIELMNLTVAEDYMNRLETDGGNLLTDLDVKGSDLSTLEDFLTDYESLWLAVKNDSVENAYKSRAHIKNSNRINRETQDSLDFAHTWQGLHSGQDAAIRNSIFDILKHFGYSVASISAPNLNAINQKSYTVTFTEQTKARNSYPHPFAIFGTEIFTKGLEVIYLGANRKSENVAQVLSDMISDRGTICLMDNAMTLPERRTLAKAIKTDANLKNIIVIDKVMALYLTRFDDANRGKKMLQATLPFARVQPYTSKGKGVVAPEMFIGRTEELDKIRDMSGPVFVYGGRQLGKSALLRQVKSIEHNPSQLSYAFFIDLKNLDSEQTLKKIVFELTTAKLIGEVDNWSDFSFEMHKLLAGQLRGVYKPKKLLLLFDESDTFLSSKDSESAINVLRELFVAFNGQFKFILAGVHKVIRFEQNSSFTNLSHISVLPFRPTDAMELLIKPMSYLGFRIEDDSLISAIFSRTNYYPGLIQYYCNMLVDEVGNNYAKKNFDVTKNPPYKLDDEYLKNMLSNDDFQKEINARFKDTLNLDDDNYYEIIALAVALIYYEHNRPVSVEVTEIRDVCLMCGVDKITKLTDTELLSLLDEMVALNLLRRVDGKFEFNRYAFWHMMGTEIEVNEKLDSYGLKAD